MSKIKWKGGAVCFASGKQWFQHTGSYLMDSVIPHKETVARDINSFVSLGDFQLNEIRVGDYIEKSELDNVQKYDDVVEVFGLFGIIRDSLSGYSGISEYGEFSFVCIRPTESGRLGFSNVTCGIDVKRKLTYIQLMAIGKIKRMMIERDSCEERPLKPTTEKADNVRKPSHYQLIDGVESIEIIARSMTAEQWKGFCLGNMLKYRIRAGKKDALQQDIDKANYYSELYESHKGKCYESNN